jgi:hypothetical protein
MFGPHPGSMHRVFHQDGYFYFFDHPDNHDEPFSVIVKKISGPRSAVRVRRSAFGGLTMSDRSD